MVAVNAIDGINYGFRVMGYFVVAFVVAGALIGIGASLFSSPDAGNSPIGGVLFGPLGSLILQASFFGILYKVIADAVSVGSQDATGQ